MPAWDRSIDLFINVGLAPEYVLLASRASLQPSQRPVLVSGDKHRLRVWLVKPAAAGTTPTTLGLAVGDQLIFAGKASARSAALLFSASGFAEVNDADGLHYEALLDLTSQVLRDAFGDDGAINAVCDIEVQNAANTQRRSRQFGVRVQRGAYNNEADPAPAEPAYPAPGALLTSGQDTATIKRGALNLTAGERDGVAIAFATEFATPPTTVRAWVMKKAGAAALQAFENHDSITTEGFTVDLGAAVPGDAAEGDYQLAWMAIL